MPQVALIFSIFIAVIHVVPSNRYPHITEKTVSMLQRQLYPDTDYPAMRMYQPKYN